MYEYAYCTLLSDAAWIRMQCILACVPLRSPLVLDIRHPHGRYATMAEQSPVAVACSPLTSMVITRTVRSGDSCVTQI